MKIWSKFSHFLGQKMGQKIEKKNIKLEEIFHRQEIDNIDRIEEKNIKLTVKKNILYIKKTLALSTVEC